MGCGTGKHDLLLLEKNYEILGFDISKKMISEANLAKDKSQYKNKNPIAAYRDFYCGEKKNLLFWTKRMKPEWVKIN